MIVPNGIFERNNVFPTSGATPSPDFIFCPTFKPLGAMIYFLSPSSYTTKAILAVLFGSYSILLTVASIPSLLRRKSMIRYLCLCPPPRYLIVIFPSLFLPPDFFSGANKDFSGVLLVTISKAPIILCLCPGVTGFNFLTAILIKYCYKNLFFLPQLKLQLLS